MAEPKDAMNLMDAMMAEAKEAMKEIPRERRTVLSTVYLTDAMMAEA
jgi:hypothetical protein